MVSLKFMLEIKNHLRENFGHSNSVNASELRMSVESEVD